MSRLAIYRVRDWLGSTVQLDTHLSTSIHWHSLFSFPVRHPSAQGQQCHNVITYTGCATLSLCFSVFKIKYVSIFSCLRFYRRTYCTSCMHSSCLLHAYHTPAAHGTVSHSAVLCNSHLHDSDYCCCLPPPRHFPSESLVCILCCPGPLTTLLYLLVQTLAVRVQYVEQETPPNRACNQREQLYSRL